jgi:hypothetical protein
LRLDPRIGFLAGSAVRALPADPTKDHGIEGLFEVIETTLYQDHSRGQHNYATATFDPVDGHPLRFVHRIRGTHQRIEFHVKRKTLPKS